MKHGKRPTREQRKFIKSWGLCPENWLVTVDAPDRMELVHRHSDKTKRIIHKGGSKNA